jgi:hypothetical protein
MIYYRIRLTRATWMLLGAWVVMWIIWVVPGHRWSVVFYDASAGEWIIHQPINWVVYQFVKSIKVVLIPVIYSLQSAGYVPWQERVRGALRLRTEEVRDGE